MAWTVICLQATRNKGPYSVLYFKQAFLFVQDCYFRKRGKRIIVYNFICLLGDALHLLLLWGHQLMWKISSVLCARWAFCLNISVPGIIFVMIVKSRSLTSISLVEVIVEKILTPHSWRKQPVLEKRSVQLLCFQCRAGPMTCLFFCLRLSALYCGKIWTFPWLSATWNNFELTVPVAVVLA